MLKRVLAMVLAAALLLTLFSGCGKETGVKVLGDTKSRDPLRICIDLQEAGTSKNENLEVAVNDFLISLEQTAGLTDVVAEIIPGNYIGHDGHTVPATVRATTVDRLRVEIMSGGGPDVFIMAYSVTSGVTGWEYDKGDILFKHPEKIMANGIFLPLDDYMENNTRFAEWDKFPQAVLDAGRNREGQQIIPLTYTLPVLYLPKSAFDYTPDRELFWEDMLSDPALSPAARELANCYTIGMNMEGEEIDLTMSSYLEYILGDLADFENEQLAFTEEELLQRINEIFAMEKVESYRESSGAVEVKLEKEMSQRYFGSPMTMIPLYSDDGGVTAQIQNYAAVNRNTKKPDEAYKVIDLLMSTYMQANKPIYYNVLYDWQGIPLHEDLFLEAAPLGRWDYLTEENHRELSELRGQITHANFKSELTYLVGDAFSKCEHADVFDKTVEELAHETYVEMERRIKE